jgi:hypothetical protein
MHVGTKPMRLSLAINPVFAALLGCISTIMTITRTGKRAKSPMGALGPLALFIHAKFSSICNTPRDRVFPDRVIIKITISYQCYARKATVFMTLLGGEPA